MDYAHAVIVRYTNTSEMTLVDAIDIEFLCKVIISVTLNFVESLFGKGVHLEDRVRRSRKSQCCTDDGQRYGVAHPLFDPAVSQRARVIQRLIQSTADFIRCQGIEKILSHCTNVELGTLSWLSHLQDMTYRRVFFPEISHGHRSNLAWAAEHADRRGT